jgi:hypothetical protein
MYRQVGHEKFRQINLSFFKIPVLNKGNKEIEVLNKDNKEK